MAHKSYIVLYSCGFKVLFREFDHLLVFELAKNRQFSILYHYVVTTLRVIESGSPWLRITKSG